MKSLMKVKERPGMMDMKDVVYSISCAECPATYAGETGRTLKVRMGSEEQRSQEWNCHACPKDWTHYQLARSKDPREGGNRGRR